MKGSTARKVDQTTDAQGRGEDDFLEFSLDIKEDGYVKTGIRLNEYAIRPDQARELDRKNWWACPAPLALLCMTSKL